MANLNSWQKISRVMSGMPWGDGASGSATISSDPNIRASITGTATQTTGTAGSSGFANGDVVVLHQTQGTGAGQWEINKVASGGGTTSLTFQVALQYTYGTGAQIIKVPRYTTATVSAHSITGWDGTVGGIGVICAKTSITVSGTLNGAGLGQSGGGGNSYGSTASQGAGTGGNGTQAQTANGSGGGGSATSGASGGGGGGGGGHNASGDNGTNGEGSAGTGGGAVGSTDLITLLPGGAGGGATGGNNGAWRFGGSGGGGGAIFILISKSITLSAAISVNGAAGSAGDSRAGGGGGGAGGSVLVVCETASLGTAQITSTAGGSGAGAGGGGTGGTGSVGRIAVHHSGTVTGTTNPTFTDVSDATLNESVTGGAFLFNMI